MREETINECPSKTESTMFKEKECCGRCDDGGGGGCMRVCDFLSSAAQRFFLLIRYKNILVFLLYF